MASQVVSSEPRLYDLGVALRSGRWLILCVSFAAASTAGICSLYVAKQYSSTVVISAIPDSLSNSYSSESKSILADIIGLPGVGGLDSPNLLSRQSEFLAVLQSVSLTEAYIRENNLLPILFSDRWYPVRRGWIQGDRRPVPTVWEANRYFKKYVRTITTDYNTGLTRVTVTWTDPQLAAQWANGLVKMTNDYLRAQAIAESDRRIAYMISEVKKTKLLRMQNSLSALIQRENQRAVLARGDRDFALEVVDPARVSETPSYPNTVVWISMSGLCGLLSSVLWVFARDAWRRRVPPRQVASGLPQLWVRTEPLFRPSTVAMLGLLLSAGAWYFPDMGGLKRGYDQPAIFTFQSVVLLLDWWLIIFLGLRAGEIIGQRLELRRIFASQIDDLESTRLFVTFTGLTSIGLILTYAKIFSSLSLGGALAFIAAGSGNALKESLYEQYSAGVLSLRYLVIFSASLAVYRFSYVKRWDVLYVINFLLLLISALLSSRLMFVATVVASLFLVLRRSERIRIRPVRIIVGAFLAFFVLAALNASRNSNYYEKDNLYFWGGGASSIITYLSAPFQSAIGTANHIVEISGAPGDTYREYVDIDETLNTNSSFVQNVGQFGILAWPGIALLSLGSGFLFASLQRYGRSALLMPCTAILYASSELWRLDLFRQGIFFVWLGCGLAMPIIFAFLPKLRVFGRPLGASHGN
ncbi:MAG TPA: hypothetical protein VNR70_13765 [Steroidobacteraceae bacterium]|nr:hypothetical protein [Steroidobacteraceae bacterium]